MNNPSSRTITSTSCGFAASLATCAVLGFGVAGCGSEPEEVVVAPREYTPPPPEDPQPTVTPIDELMALLRIDDRIYLAEDRAPDNDSARKAVLEFFDGFVRGDDRVVGQMLTRLDRRELEAMVESGQWDRSIEGITAIEIQTSGGMGSGIDLSEGMERAQELVEMDAEGLKKFIESGEFREMIGSMLPESEVALIESMMGEAEADEMIAAMQAGMQMAYDALSGSGGLGYSFGQNAALGIFDVDGEVQVQLWYYTDNGNGFQFEAAPTPPNMVNRLSGTDWIASWHEIIAYEMMLANRPDERVRPPQRRLDDDEQSTQSPSDPGGGPGRSIPGGPPPPAPRPPQGPARPG